MEWQTTRSPPTALLAEFILAPTGGPPFPGWDKQHMSGCISFAGADGDVCRPRKPALDTPPSELHTKPEAEIGQHLDFADMLAHGQVAYRPKGHMFSLDTHA